MNRLLFAAARGARVQRRFFREAHFQNTIVVRLDNLDKAESDYDYRIHPEDEHLQYGPISSALREFAENGREPYTLCGYAAMQMFRYECQYRFVLRSDWPHAQMFALFIAEALADEGL